MLRAISNMLVVALHATCCRATCCAGINAALEYVTGFPSCNSRKTTSFNLQACPINYTSWKQSGTFLWPMVYTIVLIFAVCKQLAKKSCNLNQANGDWRTTSYSFTKQQFLLLNSFAVKHIKRNTKSETRWNRVCVHFNARIIYRKRNVQYRGNVNAIAINV